MMRSTHVLGRDVIGITAMTVAVMSVFGAFISMVNGQPLATLKPELLVLLVAAVVCGFAVLADDRNKYSRHRRF